MTVPPTDPSGLPDLASPGYWCIVIDGSTRTRAWVQTAIDTSEDHVPQPPTQGTPGTWKPIYGGVPPTSVNAWFPDTTQINPLKGTAKTK
jgi:hypothetical protein